MKSNVATDKIFFIRSYAHAIANNITPCDSIVGTVFNASKREICAYQRGHTFSDKDMPIANSAINEYECVIDGEVSTIYASKPFYARVVALELFGEHPLTLFQVITERVRV